MAKKNTSPSLVSSGASASPEVMLKQTTKLKTTRTNGQDEADVMEEEGDSFVNKAAESTEDLGDSSMKQFLSHNSQRVILNVGGQK